MAVFEPLLAVAFPLLGSPVTWLEIAAFGASLWMVVANMRVQLIAWPLAIAASLAYLLLFAHSKLYGEATLQLLFVAVAAWGWWQWRRGKQADGAALAVRYLGQRARWLLAAATLAAWPLLGLLLRRVTDSDVPFWDALPTAGSIAGQWLLGRQYVENWPVWVLVNALSIALFAYKGLWLTVLLYALFAVLALVGWRAWAQARSAMTGKVIAIVGAESTGKSTLAAALAARIGAQTGLRCTVVGEFLREWCDRERRTPRADEQQAIAGEQQRRIAEAAASHEVVVADTVPLMIAVYSRLLFADASLIPMAIAAQRGVAHTLLTALDLPWVADGHQRDGEHVRVPVDSAVRALLAAHGLGWSVVGGQGDERLERAFDAVTPLLTTLAPAGAGLFTRLAQRDAAAPVWRWVCEKCDVPDCEHAALRLLQGP